jgi:TatD DNase family protein
MFTDAHIHVAQIPQWEPVEGSAVCAASHSPEETSVTDALRARFGSLVQRCCGVHPQNPDEALLPWLEARLREGMVDAIGEAGFDLYTPEYAARITEQERVWEQQVAWAVHYEKPLVVHCRKALDRIFRDAALLKECPAVVFHSFSGSPEEALSLRKHGVKAFFSFGKPLLNGNKRAIRCVEELPPEYLLAETDAPWQALRGETATVPGDIKRVYTEMARLRGVTVAEMESLTFRTFCAIFFL